ncbi:MAG: FKBP-type peptidyl-prolyl cis-trans isomerase [Promethearchaeota archaeon]
MGVIFVGIVVGIVAIVVSVRQNEAGKEVIEDGDVATIKYTMWVVAANGSYDPDHPYQSSTFDANFTKGQLIEGFRQECLGLEEGARKTFYIPACSDVDGDGKDDSSGDECLGYGTPGHDLYNTTLRYKIEVEDIIKSAKNGG